MTNPWDEYADQSDFSMAAKPPAAQQGPWNEYADPENLDTETGADAQARWMVGGVEAPDDRLSTLQKFYPDARPYKDGNFIFTNPKTGRPTVFNPSGIDTGDFAGVIPELAEFGGGIAGGALAIGAAPVTGGASLLTIPTAIGLGAAGGREIENTYATQFLDRNDTRGLGDRLKDAAFTTALNTGGDMLGRAASAGLDMAKEFVRPIFAGSKADQQAAKQALDAARRIGVSLPAGAVGNKTTNVIERGLSSTPGGADIVAQKYTNAEQGLGDTASNLAQQMAGGRVLTKQGAGQAMVDGAKQGGETFAANQERLYNRAFNLIGEKTKVDPQAVTILADELQQQIARAPRSLSPDATKALSRINGIIQDAQTNGGIEFGALRQIRTAIGKDLDAPMLAGSTGAENEYLKRLYGALSHDIGQAAENAGPHAQEALEMADRYTRFNMNKNIPTLQAVSGLDAEKAYNYALSSAKDGGTRLMKLKRNLPKEQWNEVAGTVFDNLGRAKAGSQGGTAIAEQGENFSVDTFLTNWNRLSPEARTALFAGSDKQALTGAMNDLLATSERLKNAMKGRNYSNTASHMIPAMGIYTALGFGATGDWKSALTYGAGGVLAPRYTAKLMQSPSFVKWLAQAPTHTQPRTWLNHLARLQLIADQEPDLADAVYGLKDHLNRSAGMTNGYQQPSGH